MLFWRHNKNLVLLTVLYLAIFGCFLMGCKEGTDSSPVSALVTGIKTEDYNKGDVNITGSLSGSNGFVGDITLTLAKWSSSQEYIPLTMTKSVDNGKFSFSNLSTGVYKIYVASDSHDLYGSTEYTFQILDTGLVYPESIIITLPQKDTLGNEVINGKILQSTDNSSVSGVFVKLFMYKSETELIYVNGDLTDSDGNFYFNNVTWGSYQVVVENELYEKTSGGVDVRYGKVTPQNCVLYIKPKAAVAQEKYAQIMGIVKKSDNTAFGNQDVLLYTDKSCVGQPYKETMTYGDGQFMFVDIPCGKNYFIRINGTDSPLYTTATITYPIGVQTDGQVFPDKISIVVDVTLKSERSICEGVEINVNSAYTGAPMELVNVKIDGAFAGTTDVKGYFRIPYGLAVGNHSVELSKEGYQTMSTSINVTFVAEQGYADCDSPYYYSMIDDTRDGYGSITGRYIDITTTQPLGGYIVRLYKLNQRPQSTRIDTGEITETWFDVDSNYILTTRTTIDASVAGQVSQEGSFKLTHLEPGWYQMYITPTVEDIPTTEMRSHIYEQFKWVTLKKTVESDERIVISQPFEVQADKTTYWTNYEQGK